MPYKNPEKDRDYKHEHDAYKSKPEQRKLHALRNQARRAAEKAGLVKVGDGKDVDHKQPLSLGGTNAPGNTRVVDAHANRAFDRRKDRKPKV